MIDDDPILENHRTPYPNENKTIQPGNYVLNIGFRVLFVLSVFFIAVTRCEIQHSIRSHYQANFLL